MLTKLLPSRTWGGGGSRNMEMGHRGMWVSRHSGDGLMVGHDDLRGFFQP